MLFALRHLFILSICMSNLHGSDVIRSSTEASTAHFTTTTSRPLPQRNQTKITRNDQLLSLLATRRRNIIQNRFRNHIKSIVDISNSNSTNISRKYDTATNPNNSNTVNLHLNLSDILHNAVNITSNEHSSSTPNAELNIVNVSSPRSVHKNTNRKNVSGNREPSQIQENKNNTKANMPIIRNILFRRKMSYLNRKLPLDFDQIAYDTLGLSAIGKTTDDLIMDAEDSLQVEESSHDKLIYYDVKNNSSKNTLNNFDDISEETKMNVMNNKTYQQTNKSMSNDASHKNVLHVSTVIPNLEKNITKTKANKSDLHSNDTYVVNSTQSAMDVRQEQKINFKANTKLTHKDNKTDTKVNNNNTHFMPQSLYNYFRPPEDVPEEDMQPFLHFGDKLSVSKPNISKHQSLKPTQIIPKDKPYSEENVTHKHEEEVDENMDVSIVKPIYENKIPKTLLPNQKVTVVQQYMKHRPYNVAKESGTRNSTKPEKKAHMTNLPQLRNSTRNRGFRNRTIFFHQKRNGMRRTINLKPNSTIADLKPTTIADNISVTVKFNYSTTDKTMSKKMIKDLDTNSNKSVFQNKTDIIHVRTINTSLYENTTTVTYDNMTTATQSNLILTIPIETSTKSIENRTETISIRSSLPTSTETVTVTIRSTEISPKVIELTTLTAPTKTSTSTTIITPTTRILATDVVTSISVKSSFSESMNKTKEGHKDERIAAKNKTELYLTASELIDPEATVIAQLNNFTSQTFKNNMTNITSARNPATSFPSINGVSPSLTTLNSDDSHIVTERNKPDESKPKPTFYLNKTDFIINVPDTDITKTTELVSENANENVETETAPTLLETTTEQHLFDVVQIRTRISHEDVTVQDIATMTSTTRSEEHETSTIKSIIYTSSRPIVTEEQSVTMITPDVRPSESPKRYPTTAKSSRKFVDVFHTPVPKSPEQASELPLATLFSVIEFKKNEISKNSSLPSSIIPGVETVISKKNENYSTFDNIHAAYILASLGIIPMAVIIIYVIRSLMKRNNKCFEDFEAELQDDKATIISPVARLPALISDSSSKWEFPRSKLRLQTLLGQGNFGQVWKAEADDLKGHVGLTRLVAVKTIKDGAGSKERDDLLKELAIMQKMGTHPNVVTLLGCCTEKEPYLLIMEYVMYGKLLTYLRDHRTRRDYFNFSDDAATLTARDLTVFAYCVARGMEYLGTKGIIHRDLAARNILVDHNKLCKIADFGMSRDCHGDEEVTEPRQPRNALPVRWMAIESLLYSVFTYKTDVWSFGILLWEIVTLGSSPYANMSGREVMRLICDGYRLERPNHCKPELYHVMARTWNDDPAQRPSFTHLRTELATMLENAAAEGSYVDLESFRADSTVYEIDNCTPRGNYFEVKGSRFSEFECDI